MEQPNGSMLEFYPCFRWAIGQMIEIDGVKSATVSDCQIHPKNTHTHMDGFISQPGVRPAMPNSSGFPHFLVDVKVWSSYSEAPVCLLQFTVN